MSRKMKLALGIGLGAIVATGAISTIAVSCARDNDSGSSSNHQQSGGGYNPSPAIRERITLSDYNRIKDNLDELLKITIANTEAQGGTNVKGSASITVDGDYLIMENSSSVTMAGNTIASQMKSKYYLIPNSEGKIAVTMSSKLTNNGSTTVGPDTTTYFTVEEVDKQLRPYWDGSILNGGN